MWGRRLEAHGAAAWIWRIDPSSCRQSVAAPSAFQWWVAPSARCSTAAGQFPLSLLFSPHLPSTFSHLSVVSLSTLLSPPWTGKE
jgi:hypothetical protein